MTKIGENNTQPVCGQSVLGRGRNLKYRALRLDASNFSWKNEPCTLNLKARVLDCTYVVSNNDLVRVKGAIVLVDVHPFVEWCESHYGVKVRNKSKQVALRRGKLALCRRDVPRADYKWNWTIYVKDHISSWKMQSLRLYYFGST